MATSNTVDHQPKQWGVTRPCSLAYPTEDEGVSTLKLVEVLAQSYPRKSKEESNKQKSTLEKLQNDLDINYDSCIAKSILELIPHFENFRTALWCVKNWAKKRNIWCNNVRGFLSEIEWAILVARVCQAYPNATPSTLVIKFFATFDKWCWPNPVGLCLIEPGALTVWDRGSDEEAVKHCMPIISPLYPHINLKSDATVSTLREMKVHFKFGDEMCKKIKKNMANWEDLFEPYKFFEQYIRYLHIDIVADSEADLMTLKSCIEPQLTLLTSKIEKGQR